MGGSQVHTKVSGVADMEVESDEECLATVRRYLSFFPSHNQEPPPVAVTDDPVDRRCEEPLRHRAHRPAGHTTCTRSSRRWWTTATSFR